MAADGTTSPDYSILAAFQGQIRRPKTGLAYHLCLFLVTGTMLLLPLVYFVLLALLAWAVYYHAFHDWTPIMSMEGPVIFLKLFLYFVPLFAGIVVLFFMLKPFLARRPKRAQPLALNPADEPLLYAFISKICDVVGAPSPKRIDLDCRLNASASLRRGFRSMAGNDLVLTIGLPLVANFSARELAGVIAHEFGHFTQGTGMRLSYTIHMVNFWFARIAYERDAWDEAVERWSYEERDARVAMLVWSIQLAVWFSRLILKLLVFIGTLMTGFMSRQMEYNADAYQIQIVGTETFEITHRKLATLDAAMERATKQVRNQWKNTKKLPDNFSELLRQTHESLPADVLQRIDDTLGFHRTGLLDSHPSPADRIRRARMANEPGIFHDDRPASALFASFEHPARFVTLLHYTDNLGIPITSQMLQHVESAQPKEARGYLAGVTPKSPAEEYFLGVFPLLAPLRITPPVPSINYEADVIELNQIAGGLRNITEQLAPFAAQYQDASAKLVQARSALCLLQAGVAINPEPFGLANATAEFAQTVETQAAATRNALRHSLREIATALNRRLQLALALRLSDKGESGADNVPPEQVQELVAALNQSADDYARRRDAMDALAVLDRIAEIIKAEGETPPLSLALKTQKEIVNSLLDEEPVEIKEPAPKPGLHLARQQHHLALGDIKLLQQNSLRWLSDYDKMVDQLAEIAHAAEKISL